MQLCFAHKSSNYFEIHLFSVIINQLHFVNNSKLENKQMTKYLILLLKNIFWVALFKNRCSKISVWRTAKLMQTACRHIGASIHIIRFFQAFHGCHKTVCWASCYYELIASTEKLNVDYGTRIWIQIF